MGAATGVAGGGGGPWRTSHLSLTLALSSLQNNSGLDLQRDDSLDGLRNMYLKLRQELDKYYVVEEKQNGI
jgi:hypothetical protein